jgi:hypothetical protein
VKKISPADDSIMGHFSQRIGTAMIAGLLCSLTLYPLDTAKRLMQLNGAKGFQKKYNNAIDCVFKNNVQTLYRGVPLYAATSVGSAFVQFWVYDLLSKRG